MKLGFSGCVNGNGKRHQSVEGRGQYSLVAEDDRNGKSNMSVLILEVGQDQGKQLAEDMINDGFGDVVRFAVGLPDEEKNLQKWELQLANDSFDIIIDIDKLDNLQSQGASGTNLRVAQNLRQIQRVLKQMGVLITQY